MTRECIVFPIKITGYGEITGMDGWQTFVTHYKHQVEALAGLRQWSDSVEATLGAPDDPEAEWDVFAAIQKLKGEDINKQLLKACKYVEWVTDSEQQTESTAYCPWCWGVEPGQWHENFKAQVLEVGIGHSEDCLRQAAIAAAEGEA